MKDKQKVTWVSKKICTKIQKHLRHTRNYSAKEPICRNGSPLSDESKDGIKRGLSVFPCRVGNGMESVEGIGAGIGTEAT